MGDRCDLFPAPGVRLQEMRGHSRAAGGTRYAAHSMQGARPGPLPIFRRGCGGSALLFSMRAPRSPESLDADPGRRRSASIFGCDLSLDVGGPVWHAFALQPFRMAGQATILALAWR